MEYDGICFDPIYVNETKKWRRAAYGEKIVEIWAIKRTRDELYNKRKLL